MVETFYLTEVLPVFIATLVFSTIILMKISRELVNALVFITGLALFILRPALLYIYGENISAEALILLEHVDLGIAPALILSSLISFKKVRKKDTHASLLVLLVLIIVPILYHYLYSGDLMPVAKILSFSFANWLIWHGLTDILAYIHVKGYSEKGYTIIVPKKLKVSSKDFTDYISKTATLIFYGFSLITFVFSIINIDFSGLEMSVLLAKASWITLVFSSVFLVPVKWLLDDANLRAYSRENFCLEDIKVWGIIEEFAGATAAASFIILMYQLAGTFTGVTSVWRFAYTLTLITLMAEIPVVALPILLYSLFSLNRHIEFIYRLIKPLPVSSLEELERLNGGSS
ncbi:MAG: hypothetical protein DRJ52_03600 [Thermoprotei archaeon]|nr:MAG: hypothetical protein DRJ52_03600 [Thermoprotei archaeon]